MTTATQIISQALGLIGIKAPGEAVDGNEAADLLRYLNTLLDGWATQNMNAYATQRLTATLTGTPTATIGPTGTFITPVRPARIEPGSFFSSGSYDYPVTGINLGDYNDIAYKGVTGFSPQACYYEPTLPNGTLYLYPQVSGPVTLMIRQHLTVFASLATDYLLPTGYERALAYSLAEDICSHYERTVTPQTAKIAALARRDIQRLNHQVPSLSGGRAGGNIMVGWENG